MARTLMLLALGSALVLPASASQPGQPLDCSDWVFTDPALHCSYWRTVDAVDCQGSQPPAWCGYGYGAIADAEGRDLLLKVINFDSYDCVASGTSLNRLELWSYDGVNAQILGRLDPRCVPQVGWDGIYVDAGPFAFSPVTGVLRVRVRRGCSYNPCPYGGDGPAVVFAIGGFTTLFDVLQTYTPAMNTLGFRVPYMPEGLPAADHFDTYYGALTSPIDFTQAQPLQCNYPASPPSVGDYMTVADPLPNPAPGSGRYYVTGVSYEGQRRYGRQRVGGVLSGRDPALLPTCSQQ